MKEYECPCLLIVMLFIEARKWSHCKHCTLHITGSIKSASIRHQKYGVGKALQSYLCKEKGRTLSNN